MRSSAEFYVFDKWADAASHAFGGKDTEGLVPSEDKEAYWRIYSEIVDAAQRGIARSDDRDQLILKPRPYSRARGARGHRPTDLWVSICNREAEQFSFYPQVYMIASSRGLEVGFAASISEDDYYNADVKARSRRIIPWINSKLPEPDDELTLSLDRALAQQGQWHFNHQNRLVPGKAGFDEFASVSALLAFLKSEGDERGSGCVCRIFNPAQLDATDALDQFQLALQNFAPLLARCAPSPWDVHVRQEQNTVDDSAPTEVYDPSDEEDGRRKVLAEVARRQGQGPFRDKLLLAYDGRCAITATNVSDALQAAHITPYLGPQTNHVTNGLLLRADVHSLFDLGLIRVHPKTHRVSVSPVLAATEYWAFNGQELRVPSKPSERPSALALAAHFNRTEGVLDHSGEQDGRGSDQVSAVMVSATAD